MKELFIYNTLTSQKEAFMPTIPGYVGMYVCGPTVYNDPHLGNCRTFTSFDIIYRLFLHLGYKVRYVRNITDVGHLVGDVDTGAEDKIGRMAKLQQLEPMEIVQHYSNSFHDMMRMFNNLPPNIEPSATGHIIEQIELIEKILENGLAYEVDGSVYFDTLKYAEESGQYGKLSGRIIDDLIAESRDNLKNQDEKRHPSDFALWIKADAHHLMRWPSRWSIGFPGWHLECSAMSTKYLGNQFDIHGGGQDLKFPHHENEIAQNYGSCGCNPAKYWMHGNMLLLNGKKMSKSDGNSILPNELFSGNNEIFPEAFSPMSLRFFMLQSHYRSTLDLTFEGLKASEKGYQKMKEAFFLTSKLKATNSAEHIELNDRLEQIENKLYEAICDDVNTPRVIAELFELVSVINIYYHNPTHEQGLNTTSISKIHSLMQTFLMDIMGLNLNEDGEGSQTVSQTDQLMEVILSLRAQSRANKDWATSDLIRDKLQSINIQIKDGKDGATWSFIK